MRKMEFGNQNLAEIRKNGIQFAEHKFSVPVLRQPVAHIPHWKVNANHQPEIGSLEINVPPHLPDQVRQEQTGHRRSVNKHYSECLFQTFIIIFILNRYEIYSLLNFSVHLVIYNSESKQMRIERLWYIIIFLLIRVLYF